MVELPPFSTVLQPVPTAAVAVKTRNCLRFMPVALGSEDI
jgi:hypothetical protein